MIQPNLSPRDILEFYIDAGVDCALADAPINRLNDDSAPAVATSNQAPRTLPLPMPAVPRAEAAPAPDVAIESARALAPTAGSLDELRALLDVFEGCSLKATATKLVFADGNPQAKVMFVGEAPGRDEDLDGRPFVGRSGKLLDLMLQAIGLDRTSVYIANIIPWRPPGNRDPSPHETQICLPFIKRQIELVDPDVLVCLGKPSSQAVLEVKDGIMKARGRWMEYDTGKRKIRAIATFHPAYLLRSPGYKKMSWHDLRSVARELAKPSTLN